jgi:cell wall-associated NlpC family hydrolase
MHSNVTRTDIVETARKYLGVRWRHQGRNELGIDCVGLIVRTAHDLGLSDYDSTNYKRRSTGLEFINHFRNNMREKSFAERKPGDVILFRDDVYPCHCGIVGQQGSELTVIHAYAVSRKVIEEPIRQGSWIEKAVACFEFIGVTDG